MTRRGYFSLFILGLAVNLAAAWFVRQPGYMDAYYYFGGARELVRGRGFTEPYLWNYLDAPTGLPHPSHLYWMPLTSLVAAACMAVFGDTFRTAQLPFVFLAALLPPFTAALASRFNVPPSGDFATFNVQRSNVPPSGDFATFNARTPLIAGLLAVFPGFYLSYWATADTFALFGLLGAGCLVAAWRGSETGRARWWALSGLLAGLAHLTRADGILLVVVAAAWGLMAVRRKEERFAGSRKKEATGGRRWPSSFFLLPTSYFLTVLPWLVRNYLAVGAPLAPGASAALWLRDYNQLFSLAPPTAADFLAQGWRAILAARWSALLANLQTALTVQGMIFLWPFALLAARRLRPHPLLHLPLTYYLLLLTLMTLFFPFPGARGGLFHSGTVILPFVLALAPSGIVGAVQWVAARRRSWRPEVAAPVFMGGAVLLAAGLSLLLFRARVLGADPGHPAWNQADAVYDQIGAALPDGVTVAVNNPPGFTYHTGLPAIVILDGPPADLLTVAGRYGARYVVLDANLPAALAGLYLHPDGEPRLRRLRTFADGQGRPVTLYEVNR